MQNSLKYSTNELSFDTFFEGKVTLYQPKKGYRFSVDAPILTWFACNDKIAQNCADLGCGCGVIGISLLVAQQVKHVVGVEIQPKLADLSVANAKANDVQTQIDIVNTDIQKPHPQLPDKQFDLIVSNPPFWPSDAGRLPPDEERRIARHEIAMTLSKLISTAKRLLHPKKGRLCIAFPALRLEVLFATISQSGLHATKAVFVHPHHDSPAELVLLEIRWGRAGQLKVMPPLHLCDRSGNPTRAAQNIFSGDFSSSLKTKQDARVAVR